MALAACRPSSQLRHCHQKRRCHGNRPRRQGGNLAKVLFRPVPRKYFPPQEPLAGRKMWLAFNPPVCGKVIVDEGAEDALRERGKSLLPSGIVGCEGEFSAGIWCPSADLPGKGSQGLVNYDASELKKIKGLKSNQIRKCLGLSRLRRSHSPR